MEDQNRTSGVLIGESYVGEGAEAAHINTVLGDRDGPVGTAWATALATPRPGHAAFVVILRPNLPVKPLTLFVNKAPWPTNSTATSPGVPPRRAWPAASRTRSQTA